MDLKHKKQNILNLYVEVSAFGVVNGIVMTFLAVYALRLGATEEQVGLITALPALTYVLWFIPAGRLVESRRNIKAAGLVGIFLSRIQYALLALLPFLPGDIRVPGLLAIIMLAGIPLCVANVAITSIMADIIPPAERPRVMSNRSILVSITTALSAFFGGRLLEMLPLPLNYQVLFFIAFICGLISVFFLSRLVVPQVETVTSFSLQPRQFAEQVREIVSTVRGSRDFMLFTLAAFVLHWGFVYAWPLFSLWLVNGLRASDGLIGMISTINMICLVVSNRLWAGVAERKGNRFVLLAGFAMLTVMPILYYVAPRAEVIILVEMWGGVASAAFNLGLFNTLLEVSPVTRRPAYIAFYSAAINLPLFIAPLIATGIAAPALGVHTALGFGSVLRVTAWIIMFLLLRQSRPSAKPLAASETQRA
jgi:MFS family permease